MREISECLFFSVSMDSDIRERLVNTLLVRSGLVLSSVSFALQETGRKDLLPTPCSAVYFSKSSVGRIPTCMHMYA